MKRRMASLVILVVLLLLAMPMLTLNIRSINADPGNFLGKVVYSDKCPVEGALIKVKTLDGTLVGACVTNETGYGETTLSLLADTWYRAWAYYPPPDIDFGNAAFQTDSDGNGNVTITGTYEITPPMVTILQPQNITYSTSSVPLNFTIDDYSPISWIGYSLDNQPNVTITGNTTLSSLTWGKHNIIVYANDTYGNMGSSEKIYFTKIGCVTIRVQYQDGNPRSGADVWYKDSTWTPFGTTNESGLITQCSLLDSNTVYQFKAYYPPETQFGDTILVETDENGDGSGTITAPYESPCVTVTVQYKDGYPRSGAVVWKWLPLPHEELGTTNESGLVTNCGNLDQGTYQVRAYWPDDITQFGPNTDLDVNENGHGTATVQENYEITPPAIEVLSPENMTYINTSVPLNFTVYDFSSISWIGYSLDDQANVTISGNTTLTDLAIGPHTTVIYANDTYGNMGSSDKIYFTISTHDIAVTSVVPSKTVVGQGYSMNINVTVENQGSYTESFNVSVFYDDTIIILPDGKNHTTTTLTSGNSTTLTFLWNTTGVAKGNYTITAKATILPGETDTTDNTIIDGIITITIPGDVDGDFDVDLYDAVAVCAKYGFKKGHPEYDPNCDINNNDQIFLYDAVIVGAHYGQKHP